MSIEPQRSIAPAPLSRRIVGFVIDCMICVALPKTLMRLSTSDDGAITGLVLAVIYFIVRDALFGGRSVGKIFVGLRVLNNKTLASGGILESFRRNGMFVLLVMMAEVLAGAIGGIHWAYAPFIVIALCAAFSFRYIDKQLHRTKMDMIGGSVVVYPQ
jgi:hypothetical protein